LEEKSLLKEILSGIKIMGTDIKDLKSDVTGLKSDVTGLKSDVTELKSDVKELKSDVTELKSDVAGLKSDVSGLKIDVSKIKKDVSNIESDVAGIKIRQKEDHQILKALEHSAEVNKVEHDRMNIDIARIQGLQKNISENLDAMKDIIGRHEIDITVLKRRPV